MMVMMKVCVCDACDWHWLPKRGTKRPPVRCAKCKTTAWNKKARQLPGVKTKPTYHGIGRPPVCYEETCVNASFRHTVNRPDCILYKKYAEKPVPPPPPPPPKPLPVDNRPLHQQGVPIGEHHSGCPCFVCRGKRELT